MSVSPSDAADITGALSAFSAELDIARAPAACLDKLKLCVLDAVACVVQGSTLPWSRTAAAVMTAQSAAGTARVFASNRTADTAAAAFANATAGHGFELDDIHKESILHPGSLAVPVALACAQSEPACGPDRFYSALLAGYETGCRVGSASAMPLFFRGFHPQGTAGAFVTGATAARFLGLSAEQTRHTFGIAGSLGAGLMASQEGAMVKRAHAGWAAYAGVLGARLAGSGFTGIRNVVEAEYGGFLSAHGGVDADRSVRDLGQTWETLAVGHKPYASVTSIHAALDGVRRTLAASGAAPGDIERLRIGVSAMTLAHCAWPYQSQSATAAQMNIYFCVASLVLYGDVFLRAFLPDRLADPAILAFMERIEVCIDNTIEQGGPPLRHGARVTLAAHGKTYVHEELHRRGSPENPMGTSALREKFHRVLGEVLAADLVEELGAAILASDSERGWRDMLRALDAAAAMAAARPTVDI